MFRFSSPLKRAENHSKTKTNPRHQSTKCAAESKFSKLRNGAVHELKMTKFGHNTVSTVAIPNEKEEGKKKEKKKPPHQPQQEQPESTTCTSGPCSTTDNSLPIPSDEGRQATGAQQPTGHLLTKTVLTEHHIRPRHLRQQLQQHHAATVLGEHVGEVELGTAQGHHITDAATAQACWR